MVNARTTLWIGLLAAALAPYVSGQQSSVWALIIGVSQFRHLPADQQLEFAAKDAQAFAKFLTSPRGGGLPEGNVRLLLNDAATLGSVRRNLATWLPRNAGPNDVVYIFLATHGIVKGDTAKSAFILGTDADPNDLYTSAFPMSELDDLIANRWGRVGRIVLLADLSRSGDLRNSVHRYLEGVAARHSRLIALLASRPGEISQSGPQFCGGHGAFTCFVLKGLDGAADADKDSIVTVNELVRYASDQLGKATSGKQQLREFGNFDGDVPLAYVNKPGPADWKAFSPGPK